MDFFKNIFNKKLDPAEILDIVEVNNNPSINVFKKNLNYILNDLILPITERNTNKQNYKTLSLLSNPSNCNKLTLFLRNKINQNFNSIELSNLADEIFFSKHIKGDCKTSKCEILDNEKYKINEKVYTKRELCKIISKHYIKQLNLIAAIISAVNPDRNFCISRLKKLLKVMNEDNNKGVVEICKKDIVYDGKLTNQAGFNELLNLYYFHLIDIYNKNKDLTQDEILKIQTEYQKFVNLFNEIIVNKDFRKQEVLEDIKQDEINKEEELRLEKEALKLEQEAQKEQEKLEEEAQKEQEKLEKEQEENNDNNDNDNDNNNDDNDNNNDEEKKEEEKKEEEKKEEEKKEEKRVKEEKELQQLLNKRLDQDNSLESENQGISNKFNNLDQTINTNINKLSKSLKDKKEENKKKRRRKNKNKYNIKLEGGAKNKSRKNKRKSKAKKTKKMKNLFNLKKNYFDGEKFENKYYSKYDNTKKLNLAKTTKLFLDFVKNNNTIKKYNPSIIPLVNTSFRSYNRNKLEKLCDYSKDNVIKINLNSKLLKDYIKNYKELKEEYVNTSANLLTILEENLLNFEVDVEKNKEYFMLKTISTDELSDIETIVRTKISDLYFTCQMKYLSGIQELENYFIKRDAMEAK